MNLKILDTQTLQTTDTVQWSL